jgi:predicted O-methyltransferase YrrM
MRWYLQNFLGRLSFAVRSPRYAVRSVLRDLAGADERFLSSITGSTTKRLRAFLGEPASTPEFAAVLREAESAFRVLEIRSADLYAKKVLVQYAAVRACEPEVVVETGVANGVSTSYLLLALRKNGHGTLHSIELGDPSYLPVGKPPGWLVPDWLKPQWNLLMGDTRERLPKLLAQLGSIDVFIHDSLHTYDQMLWEYRAAFPFIRPGGLLFSDDATWNPAFAEFCREVSARHAGILRGVGFLRKNSP